MALPLLLGVEDDPEQLRLMRQELQRRYGNDYQVVCVSSAQEGLRHLEGAAAAGREVALLLANLWLPRQEGLNFFAQARARHPEANVCGTSNLENRRGYVRQPQSSGDRSSHRNGLGRSEADASWRVLMGQQSVRQAA